MNGSSKDHPIFRLTASAADSVDDKHLQTALVEIASQDPTLKIDAKSMSVSHSLEGTSASHLDSICDRLRDEYHLFINVGPIEAVLLESIRKSGEAEGKYLHQVGGLGNYGHCKLHVEPSRSGEGYGFASTVSDNVLPPEYLSAIERGVQQAMQSGVLSGHPLVDLKVTVIDGSYHAEDSNRMAFEIAGATALNDAVKNAAPVVLEPVMTVEIEVPEGLATAIRDEVYRRRGRVERDLPVNGWCEIRAVVPLSELLLSSSRALAEFPAAFAGYEPVSNGGISGDYAAGVPAIKPNLPGCGRGFEAIRPDPDDE